ERFVREQRRYQKLAEAETALLRCHRGKSAVATLVVEGKMSLEQAVQSFAALDAEKERVLGRPPENHLRLKERDRYQFVIKWICTRLSCSSDPDLEAVQARLQAEFRARFGSQVPPQAERGGNEVRKL